MRLFCVIMFLSITAVTNAVQFVDCGSKDCKIDSVDVSGCAADAQSCDFTRGQTVNMTLKFTTETSISSLTDAIAGYVADAWVPFKKIDACDEITPKCPLASGVTATFTFGLYISKDYPPINVPVKSNMTDNTGAVCTCFEIQGKIV